MEPGLGPRPPSSAGETATTLSPRFDRPVPVIARFSVKQPTMLTVLTQTRPFRDSSPIPHLWETLSTPGRNLTAPDVGVALEAAGLPALARSEDAAGTRSRRLAHALTKHSFLGYMYLHVLHK
jgi:hypothetical protein